MKAIFRSFSVASICLMLGVLGLLSQALAQAPERSYADILTEYDARMDQIVRELNATLPYSGPSLLQKSSGSGILGL